VIGKNLLLLAASVQLSIANARLDSQFQDEEEEQNQLSKCSLFLSRKIVKPMDPYFSPSFVSDAPHMEVAQKI
jgi:hypothetical protein